MKRLIKFIMSVILLSSMIINVNATTTNKQHYYGLKVESMEEVLKIADKTPIGRSVPTSVDNSALFPVPGNQRSQSSCTAWAVGYAAKSNVEYNKRNWSINEERHQFSPAYLYNQLVDAESDNKTTGIIETMKLIRDEGVCPLTYFPYDYQDYLTQPDEKQRAAAALYKGLTYYSVFSTTRMKELLADGKAVVIGIKVYPDFNAISSTNQIYDTIQSNYQPGNHAICLVGYDDNKGSGAFKFINSYGTSWGLGGYGWISYDLVNSFTNAYGPGVGFYMTSPATDNYLMGDINNDGIITSADAQIAMNISVNSIIPTGTQFVMADVDGNGIVTASDAREILQYSTGLINKFSLYD